MGPGAGLAAVRANLPSGPTASGAKIDEAGTALAAALDVVTSPQSSFAQKRAVLDQLRKGGRLEEAIATLKQLATQNPGDPSIPTALGEGPSLAKSGISTKRAPIPAPRRRHPGPCRQTKTYRRTGVLDSGELGSPLRKGRGHDALASSR